MYWRKSCACCKNWKSSLHGSRWLILIGFLKIIRCRLPELSIYKGYKGRLKSKKQPAQPIFLAEPLTPTAARPLSPRERVRERAASHKACIWAVRVLGKIAAIWRMPSPQPSPTGEGAGCSGYCGCRWFEKQLGFAAVDFRSSEKEKSSLHNLFPCRTLSPNSHPSSLPWERARERATSRKACIWAVRVLGQIAAIWRMPSPKPSPTGEGAGCGEFKRYRSSEKECPKNQQREFFR